MKVEDLPAGAAAAGAGVIALGTLIIEIGTGQLPAQVLGFDGGFISLPLGVATPLLAALAARSHIGSALPAVATAIGYWALALTYW